MTYAILTGNTITAHGPASVLWPDTSFASGGPNASFLTEAGAVTIRSDAAYDPATEFLQPCEPYLLNGKVFDTIAAPIVPPAPIPDWESFGSAMLASPGINALLAAALPLSPAPALALPATLVGISSGLSYVNFGNAWAAVTTAVPPSAELLAEVLAAAEAAHLPAEFLVILQSAP